MVMVYRIELIVIDHDNVGAEGVCQMIEETKYPNHSIQPEVMEIAQRKISGWSDDHPLNNRGTRDAEYLGLFR